MDDFLKADRRMTALKATDPSEMKDSEVDSLQREMTRIGEENDSYLEQMDRALVGMQLVSPPRILEAGRYLHDGLNYFTEDDVTYADVSARYRNFGALASLDLGSRSGQKRRALDADLSTFAGLPHRAHSGETGLDN
jgi:hypothetical protein